MRIKRENLRNLRDSGPLWNAMGSGMVSLNSVILLMFVSRKTAIDIVGEFSIALTTAQILYVVALFGINDYQMTDYQREYTFAEYFYAKLITSIIAAIACAGVVYSLKFEGNKLGFTILLTFFMLINSFAELYQSLFFQKNRLDLSGRALFFRYLISTLCFVAVICITSNAIIACILMNISNIVATIWWDIRCLKKKFADEKEQKYRAEKVGNLLKENLTLCLSTILSLVVINCPKYIINGVSSDSVQGVFGILFMPTAVINLLSLFIFKPYISRYASYLSRQDLEFRRLLWKHSGIIILLSLVCAAGMWIVGIPFLKLLFAVDLTGNRIYASLFMISGALLALNQLLYYLMVILRQQRSTFVIYLICVIASLLSGLFLITRYDIGGAWLSFTVSQLLLLLGYMMRLKIIIKGW